MRRFVGIDPSTKTGLVIMDEDGNLYNTEEIKTTATEDPLRFIDIANQLIDQLEPNDIVCIEGFSYGSRGAGVSTQYGLGWIIRHHLYMKGYEYLEVAPTSVKKFATGKGNTKKDEMVLPIYKRWGFEHNSDNVRDAYVLAQIARATRKDEELTSFQKEVMKKVGA